MICCFSSQHVPPLSAAPLLFSSSSALSHLALPCSPHHLLICCHLLILMTQGVFQHQLVRGTGLNRMPRGGGSCPYLCQHTVFSTCQVFCILIVLLLSVWAYVGIRVPCPAVVSTAHIGPPAPTLVAGGWSSPRIGLCTHASPRARMQPLGRCPELTEVMNPLQCV